MSPNSLMLADLKRSGLNGADAELMHLEVLESGPVKKLTGFGVSAYRIPYFDTNGGATEFFRLRFLGDVMDRRTGRPLRYWQPAGSASHAYFPRGIPWTHALKDGGSPLLVVEGEKKAQKCLKDLKRPTFAIGGAWSGQSKGKLIDDMESIEGTLELCPDGDYQYKRHVQGGWDGLGARMTERGVEVVVVRLPPGDKPDDYLLREGPDAFEKLPRVPFNAKATVSVLRTLKVSRGNGMEPRAATPREKRERISGLVLRDLAARGSFHIAEGEPLYFDRDEHRLLSFQDHKNPDLRAYFVNRFGINPSEAEFQFVYEECRAHAVAYGGDALTPLFSHFDAKRGVLYTDVGNNQVARVTADGHETVPNGTDDVLFRMCKTMEPVPPAKASKSALDELLRFPNFGSGRFLTAKQQALVYELSFWSLFFPTPTRPLLLLEAVKGSGKSTAARALGLTLFGKEFDVQAVDRDRLDDSRVGLINNPFVVLDNLDGHIPGLENLLAIAATGGKISRRVLFTTKDDAQYPLRARIIATSRQPDVFTRDDLRDRTIILSLDRLKNFRPESDIVVRTLERRGAVWAHVLRTLPSLIGALASYRPQPVGHRLADFARLCLALGPALGHSISDVEEMLDALESERTAFAGEHSGLLQALNYWINSQRAAGTKTLGCEDLTAGEILEQVSKAWSLGSTPFPFRRADTFGLALKNEEPVLRATYSIERRRGRANTTLITIRVREPEGDDKCSG